MLHSDQYEQALRFAAAGHRDQIRRGSDVPYVTHVVAVARIVERAGCDEATILAALLHDLVEDTATTIEDVHDRFGPTVAATVAGCSEIKLDASGRPRSWEDRKRDHLATLRTASDAVHAVVLADKLHNLICIRLDLAAGRAVWDTFHAPRDRVLWYLEAVITACTASSPGLQILAQTCRSELDRVRMAGEKSDQVDLVT